MRSRSKEFSPWSEEIRVAVLEQKLEDVKDIIVKIDNAIQKLSEVNSNVSKMLAVHEERITKQEETDSVLFAKIDKLRDKVDSDYDSIVSRVSLIEKRVWMDYWSNRLSDIFNEYKDCPVLDTRQS